MVKTNHCRGQIAEQVGCSKSTVSRELRRNCDRRDGSYWPELVQRKAAARHRAKPKRKRFTASVEAHVREKLKADYSPQQIAGHADSKASSASRPNASTSSSGKTRSRVAGCTAGCAPRASGTPKGAA